MEPKGTERWFFSLGDWSNAFYSICDQPEDVAEVESDYPTEFVRFFPRNIWIRPVLAAHQRSPLLFLLSAPSSFCVDSFRSSICRTQLSLLISLDLLRWRQKKISSIDGLDRSMSIDRFLSARFIEDMRIPEKRMNAGAAWKKKTKNNINVHCDLIRRLGQVTNAYCNIMHMAKRTMYTARLYGWK